jgi:hypothetical protein
VVAACAAFSHAPPADAALGIGHFFWLFGLLFVGVGIWHLLCAPLALLRAGSMVYGVTDRRVFIMTRRRTRSWRPADLGQLSRRDRADGSSFAAAPIGPPGRKPIRWIAASMVSRVCARSRR